MENNIEIFRNEEFGEIRTVLVNDEPWFVAIDICKCLDISNPTVAVSRLDDDERAKFNLGRQGNTNIVNEYGLYSLILASRKQEAKKFKRWVTHEVLPSLRKHGGYVVGQENMSPDEFLARAVLMAQSVIAEKDKQIAEMEPKVLYHDEVLNKPGLISTSVIAKDIGLSSAQALNRIMNFKKIIFKSGKIWKPYANYEWLVHEGYCDYRSYAADNSQPSLQWTEKGRKWIVDHFDEWSTDYYR